MLLCRAAPAQSNSGRTTSMACGEALTGWGYAAHRNITGDSSSIFAAVLKGEQTFAFELALELPQTHRKKSRTLLQLHSRHQRCYSTEKRGRHHHFKRVDFA